MTKRILGIIPARGGSKGLSRKNILPLNGKPLISWTIESSLKSKYITTTIVSSEDTEILNISKEFGAEILVRSEELAQDSSSSEVVVSDVLSQLKKHRFDYLILLQPTSPLRTSEDIDNAFDLFFKSDADALISMKKIDNKILKAFTKNEDGYLNGISNNTYPFLRRQDLPETYLSNGAIYIIEVKKFLENKSFFTNKTISYLMDDIKSIDIDTKEDLEKVEEYIK